MWNPDAIFYWLLSKHADGVCHVEMPAVNHSGSVRQAVPLAFISQQTVNGRNDLGVISGGHEHDGAAVAPQWLRQGSHARNYRFEPALRLKPAYYVVRRELAPSA